MKESSDSPVMLRWIPSRMKVIHFALLMSFLNLLFFHFPFFAFVRQNVQYKTFNGIILIASLVVLMLAANFLFFYLAFFLTRSVGKVLCALLFILNAVAFYFISTYGIIVDEGMIGNILNTNYEESSSYFSSTLVLFILVLGIIPGIYMVKVRITGLIPKKFIITASLTLLFIIALVFANAGNWLWIDKNSKKLGGLAMPWSYLVNTSLFYIHKHRQDEKEILLPDAVIKDDQKAVVVLVIGESARSQNFSLYGYDKNTNPRLSKIPGLVPFDATSCATYTTAGVKCILSHSDSDALYEILPNYLYRNNVEVIWRTTNWGEPPVHINNYQKADALRPLCTGEGCGYDEILLAGLKEQILSSKKNKILVVLHTSTSHGPTYSKKYPASFETFKPVCNSVELGDCSKKELVNAYDNTILYTDYILSQLIADLQQLKGYQSTMLFVSDHGESLGENNLYMHGMPLSIAPKEQYSIPFIVWVSEGSKHLKPGKNASQNHVFHSVLDFLSIGSPIYNEQMSIYY